ncbi:MAG: putative toxin-antitoxin system toxin component, PIN family [Propionibacteriaceae bacterium]|nr:putative toxin-antitoxin system toxin component, PIN family [Propionibacteriaceae bacterium]
MRILIDTNVFVSAVLNPRGMVAKALSTAVEGDDDVVVCDYSFAELHDVFVRKFPDRIGKLPQFMAYVTQGVTIVAAPLAKTPSELVLRDPDDQPILTAAIVTEVDAIMTGDKDLLDAGLTRPKAISPGEYLNSKL